MSREIDSYYFEHRMKHKNGRWIWMNGRGKVTQWSKENLPLIMSGTYFDITDRKKNEYKIIEMKERLANIIKVTDAGTWVHYIKTDKEVVNERWAEIIGYELKEITPINMNTLKKITHPKDLKLVEREFQKTINQEIEYYDVEFRIKHKKGKWVWINSRGKSTKWSKDGKAILMSGTHTDITERKQEQEKIEYLSFHDHLTGLYNRRYMEDSIKRLDTDRNIPFSIISADVDNLKLTNDAYGHEMGDKILIKAAEILKKSCRKEDIICRVSGDEFVILLPNIGEKKVREIIERINEESENGEFVPLIVSISTGYSTKNKEEENILKVYKEADNNMYKNKIKYSRTMGKKVIEKIQSNLNIKYDNERIHSERVSYYCESIAKAMKLGHKEIKDAKAAGKLHDIGKIAISEDILKKEKKLKEEEFQELKKHPSTSYQLLRNVDDYNHIAKAVLYHHERLDGSGYQGLKKNEIPLLSKIIAVADRYVEMTEGYPCQNKKTKEEAIEELKMKSGIKFSNDVVESLTKIV